MTLLKNTWALGDNDAGCPGNIHDSWTHGPTVSLSRCPKNQPPPGSLSGAAFKNGTQQGLGQAGVESVSEQSFTVEPADEHTFTLSAYIISVRAEYLVADLYGDGEYLGELLNYQDASHDPCGLDLWPQYCGAPLTVPHAEVYTIRIRTLFLREDSLGIKWTGLELVGG